MIKWLLPVNPYSNIFAETEMSVRAKRGYLKDISFCDEIVQLQSDDYRGPYDRQNLT